MVGSLGPCRGRFDRAAPWSAPSPAPRHGMFDGRREGARHGLRSNKSGASRKHPARTRKLKTLHGLWSNGCSMALSRRVRALGAFDWRPTAGGRGRAGGGAGPRKGAGPRSELQTCSGNSPRKRRAMGRVLCWRTAGGGLGPRRSCQCADPGSYRSACSLFVSQGKIEGGWVCARRADKKFFGCACVRACGVCVHSTAHIYIYIYI